MSEKQYYSAILARDLNNGIGFRGEMPWGMRFKRDLRFFSQVTRDSILIMGYNTYKTIADKITDRICIVITTKDLHSFIDNVFIVNSINKAKAVANKLNPLNKEIIIIGGQSIYKQFEDCIGTYYITNIYDKFDADTFFDNDLTDFDLVQSADDTDDGVKLTYNIYKRRK